MTHITQYREFVAIDGDDVGPMLRSRIIANDIKGASVLSREITMLFADIQSILESRDYEIIFCGGDSLLSSTSYFSIGSWLDDLPTGPCTISVGIGPTAEFAYLALQLAKARGKNQIVRIEGTAADTLYKWNNTPGITS